MLLQPHNNKQGEEETPSKTAHSTSKGKTAHWQLPYWFLGLIWEKGKNATQFFNRFCSPRARVRNNFILFATREQSAFLCLEVKRHQPGRLLMRPLRMHTHVHGTTLLSIRNILPSARRINNMKWAKGGANYFWVRVSFLLPYCVLQLRCRESFK